MRLTPLLLSKVVDKLDEKFELMANSHQVDIRGDAYEYLLSKISQSGRNGQFRTPRHIIRMMVELTKKQCAFFCIFHSEALWVYIMHNG